MWLFTRFGFFSIVQKPGDRRDGVLTVRGRSRSDLEALRERYLPSLEGISSSSATDYRYRARVAKTEFAQALARIAGDIDYDNFKNAVAEAQGAGRSRIYGKVWGELLELQEPGAARMPTRPLAPLARAYGGIVIDAEQRVLLFRPKNGFGGYAWTFPKGRAGRGESPEQAALREVREETGVAGRILAQIPGEFRGETTLNLYYLMRPAGETGVPRADETAAIEWVPLASAAGRLEQTTNVTGRARDLEVLKAARQILRQIDAAQN